MTTYENKLKASIAYNTDNYFLNCEISGVPALEVTPTATVEAIAMNAAGALVFYLATNSREYFPTEAACKKALEWINSNFDKLFPEE